MDTKLWNCASDGKENVIEELIRRKSLPRAVAMYMAARGVEILTCGTCLNHYGLTEKLAVGGVTNMYAIVEKLSAASKVIKP